MREDPIGAIEQGAAKIDGYVILAVSSEGTVRNGCGDAIKMELIDILKGEYQNWHTSIWYYRLDSVEEVGDPDMWPKANPNLPITVSYETIQLDVERAEKAPATRNDILANVSEFLWRDIHIISLMKKHSHTNLEAFGNVMFNGSRPFPR